MDLSTQLTAGTPDTGHPPPHAHSPPLSVYSRLLEAFALYKRLLPVRGGPGAERGPQGLSVLPGGA